MRYRSQNSALDRGITDAGGDKEHPLWFQSGLPATKPENEAEYRGAVRCCSRGLISRYIKTEKEIDKMSPKVYTFRDRRWCHVDHGSDTRKNIGDQTR